jgi:hypothetical protein
MIQKIFLTADKARLIIGAALFATLAGYAAEPQMQRNEERDRPATQVQAGVLIQDDYDYYPGYETYYNRNRHEYVYRDGDTWVRRPEPRGISAEALFAAPSVRLDFHDSPEQHHNDVIRSYPKTWNRPDKKVDAKDEHRDGKKTDKKDDKKDDDKK